MSAVEETLPAGPPKPTGSANKALALAKLGLRVFPVAVEWNASKGKFDKRPATPNGFKDATRSAAAIIKFWKAHSDAVVGVRHGDGIAVVDIDSYKNPEALDQLVAYSLTLDCPRYDTASGGEHWLFSEISGRRGATAIPGVEVLDGSGGFFVFWGDVPKVMTLQPAPAELVELLERKREVQATPASEVPSNVSSPSGDTAAAHAIAAQLDPSCDYETWFKFGAALHHDLGDAGFDIWDEWSARSAEKYPGHNALLVKWDSFGRNASVEPVTLGSFKRSLIATKDQFDDLGDADVFDEADSAKRAAKVARYQFSSPSELLARPMPTWIIDGILPQQDLAALYGPGGVGKSFLALDMALAITRGVQWFGRGVEQGRVCWVASEAAGSFRPRLEAYLKHHEISVSEIEDSFRVLGTAINLADTEEMQAFAEAAKQHAPSLVVIDTLAASMEGDENSVEAMQPVLANCRAIHEATGALVLLISHAGKDPSKGLRGSSSIYAAMHAVIAVRELDPEAGTREIEAQKMRDGEAGPHTRAAFRLVSVDVGRDAKDRPTRSAVVHHLGVAPKRAPKLSPQRQAAFDVLLEHGGGLEWNEAEKVIAEKLGPPPEADKRDRRRERAREALQWLCNEGLAERAGNRVRLNETPEDLSE